MTSALLYRFAETLVHRLIEQELLEIEEGRTEDVVERLTEHLGRVKHSSLISAITAGLVDDDDVVDLYADDDQIKAIIEQMPPEQAGLRG